MQFTLGIRWLNAKALISTVVDHQPPSFALILNAKALISTVVDVGSSIGAWMLNAKALISTVVDTMRTI